MGLAQQYVRGSKVPGSEKARERKGQGAKGPGSESSRERKFQGANWPGFYWPIRSRERIGPGAKGCESFRTIRHLLSQNMFTRKSKTSFHTVLLLNGKMLLKYF